MLANNLPNYNIVNLLFFPSCRPDVWQQLRELCLQDSLGAAAMQKLQQQGD
jgi:hypothetical protein